MNQKQPGLTSVNLKPIMEKRFPMCASGQFGFLNYDFQQAEDFVAWMNQIDDWLNENCKPNTYFANRNMRFNFKNHGDAVAFKIIFTGGK